MIKVNSIKDIHILPEPDLVYDMHLMRLCTHSCSHSISHQTRALWLLVVGLLAMAMVTFGGSGLARASETNASAGSFYAEICTTKGIAAAGQTGNTPQHDGGQHDCCKLCGASAALLTTDGTIAVAPAPTFTPLFFSAGPIPPATVAHTSHPPRGPPLL